MGSASYCLLEIVDLGVKSPEFKSILLPLKYFDEIEPTRNVY